MKKNILIGMVAVLALGLVASTAMAWGPGYGRGQGYGPQNGCPAVSNLTAEQTSSIQAIQQANFQELTPLREQLFAKRTELEKPLGHPEPGSGKDYCTAEGNARYPCAAPGEVKQCEIGSQGRY
ncbi:MAG: periplasmic heavy metal sensor [Desulfobacterales bacterium]|nr:periplasmic heavy metal sensor [Desulfobacterales bacterium]